MSDELVEDLERGPKRKRQKMIAAESRILSLLKVKDLPSLIRDLRSGSRESWNLNPIIPYLKNQDKAQVWWSVTCLGLILNLSDIEVAELRRKCGIEQDFDEKLRLEFQNQLESTLGLDNIFILSGTGSQRTENAMGFVKIGGVLVESVGEPGKGFQLVEVGSLVTSLREIGISLAKFEPICILGPVGSGKTSLLHYAAAQLGRNGYPALISVQISDQVDSRLLLGSYHSTDLPGQFVWKAGPLTKALLHGHWIILEDLDSAPADLTALLHGLIETRKVWVPGYGEIQKFHPYFRLFATWRTQTGSRSERIGRDWKQIVLDGMNGEEMKSLLATSFPHLQPILDRLLSLFRTVEEFQAQLKGSSRRRLSLRDFLKFCRRIPTSLNLMETEAAIWMFQEACDVFLASLHNPEWKQEVAESIGTHLNLLKAKTEYFLQAYQPHVSICTNSNKLTAGRHTLAILNPFATSIRIEREVFSLTKRACRLLEMISGSVKHHEPVLLIGETGVGKTSAIQYLARTLQQQLLVVNLNRQSDSGDLLGGYKPVELKYIFSPIREEFENLFPLTFSSDSNSKFLVHVMTCFANRRWKDLLQLMTHVMKVALAKISAETATAGKVQIRQRWEGLGQQLSRLQLQLSRREESPFAFSFIEGTLIRAIKNGHWILLDEINLATPEMLQCLSGVLEEDSEIHLWEKGDETPIRRHPNFHLFAAMNPATDVGKKDLPLGLRNRFTEYYVDELKDRKELEVLVSDYLRDLSLSSVQVGNIVEFYLQVRELSQTTLVDGTGKKPHFSLRTLCRALKISALNLYGSVNRSLYESFCLSFLTQLDYSSHPVVHSLVAKYIFGKTDIKSLTNQPLPAPSGKFIQVEGYWIPQGDSEPVQPPKYIVTSSIRRNLKDLVRIVSAGKLPVLIQGETSVGKTSLIEYLAKVSGNRCYRINNHQHTDLQEYVGSYQSDSTGKLVFTEGVLVNAMRRGEWIILDELNLAPSEVLEALNRLLDDNRQLFVTETGQTITAHPRFMLFATQNPPGLYGGRKLLSRAFRNRFVELHFDEIPGPELETILHLRCDIPASYCKKIIGVLRELQMRRKASAALQGKHGFATLRDLFRWAERYRQSGKQEVRFYDWDQHLADEGYLVLAGKVRKDTEAELIIEVLQKFLKRRVDPNNLFSLHENTSNVTRDLLEKLLKHTVEGFEHIVWTFQMRRLAVLIGKGMEFQEPVLLVGETGCGKTSVVQLLARLSDRPLYSLNCHMHSEGSDFLGGLRPRRNHNSDDGGLFEWVDGPLIEAMEAGGIFLADEISLADDSVLERINSVLEPERSLLLAEKGEEVPKLVVALSNFHFIATMNPGGDYGKKELSPALRNRVTEIWCEVTSSPSDLEAIIEHNLDSKLRGKAIGQLMLSFVGWLKRNDLGQRCTVSIRDYLSWTQFLNHVVVTSKDIGLSAAIQNGASLAFLDGLGTGNTATQNLLISKDVKVEAVRFLEALCAELKLSEGETVCTATTSLSNTENELGIGPFRITKGPEISGSSNNGFNFDAPTTSTNGLRVLRAMQLKKPILLEGSPGVGKTALVSALAQMSGHSIVRINLSEQTDISDLFGADLPVEGGQGGEFAWRDGPLLQALKNSSWILLDELNLASQSVLEGLNACLDHRSEVYVPELNRTFQVGAGGSRIFGCQNPVRQGGARKGLPKSFLNRFTQVFMDPLSLTDLEWILHSYYPTLPPQVVRLMSRFADSLGHAVNELGLFGSKGSPWDFNLRDLLRWASLVVEKGTENPHLFVDFVYGRRMRTKDDAEKVLALYSRTCNELGTPVAQDSLLRCGQTGIALMEKELVIGNAMLSRSGDRGREANEKPLLVLQKQLPALESLALALEMGWMPILVGPCGAGKTSLVKLVSELTGQTLRLLTVSPEMDTIELLGGFEQADIYRKVEEAAGGVREVVGRAVKWIFCQRGPELELMDSQFLALWASLNALPHLTTAARDGEDEEKVRIKARVDVLNSALRKCQKLLGKNNSEFTEKLNSLELELEEIRAHLKTGIQTGAFQWVHSILIKSILRGEWLVIEGANRCTAAVLDRLNSLMEPKGSLFLSERGSIDGKIIEVKPHPNFRLILTMDPVYGEISRAMRNRGVEIFIPGPEEVSTTLPNDHVEKQCLGNMLEWSLGGRNVEAESWVRGINLLDLDALLRAHGLLDPLLRKTLINFHGQIYEALAPTLGPADRPHISQIVQLIRSMVLEAEHGVSREDGIRNALASVYRNIPADLLANFKLPYHSGSPAIPRLSQTFPNFLNTQMYRVWKEMDHLLVVLSPFPVQPLENALQIRSQNVGLFMDQLIAASFSRLVKEDSALFASAISSKIPLKVDLISNLGQAVSKVSYMLNRSCPWDWQWSPHALARLHSGQNVPDDKMADMQSILRVSLILHQQLLQGESRDFGSLGSLGFLAKVVSDGRYSSDTLENKILLTTFYALLQSLDTILSAALLPGNQMGAGPASSERYAELWKDGISTFLWRKRLYALAHETYNPRLRNEKLDSNIRLIMSWIHREVLPFLHAISTANMGLKIFEKCFTDVDQLNEKNAALTQYGVLFRETFPTKPFALEAGSKIDDILNIIQCIFSLWSLTPTLERSTLIRFLSSEPGKRFHSVISGLSSRLQDQSEYSEAEMRTLAEIRTAIEVAKSADEPEEIAQNKALRESTAGLLEYVRDSNLLNYPSTSFFSPILAGGSFERSALAAYFCWEEKERFLSTFMNSPYYGLLPNSCFLPHFVASILLDGQTGLRNPSVGSRSVVTTALETLNSALTRGILSPLQTQRDFVTKLSIGFRGILEDIGSSIGWEWANGQEKPWMEALDSEGDHRQMGLLGSVMVEAGASLIQLAAAVPVVDPAVEKEILAGYLSDEIEFFETWLAAQNVREMLETGADIYNRHTDMVHPYVVKSAQHLVHLHKLLIEARKNIAYRPDPPGYEAIRRDINQFRVSFASVEKMKVMVQKFHGLMEAAYPPSEDELNEVLVPCQSWIDAHKNFTKKLVKEFWYWDITAPFLFASIQVSLGVSLMCDSIRTLKLGPNLSERETLFQLVQFPIKFNESPIEIPADFNLEHLNNQQISSKLFLSTIISFMNEVETEEYVSQASLKKLHSLSQSVAWIWKRSEEEKAREKELKDAMYLYKGRERSMELSDEDQEALDLSNTFPAYEDDLIDLEIQNSLEDGRPKGQKVEPEEKNSAELLSPQEITVFLKVHERVAGQAKNHWISGEPQTRAFGDILDFVTPFLTRFEVGCSKFSDYSKFFGKEEEEKFLIGANIAVDQIQYNYECPDFFRQVQLYDFYHDSNIEEVQKLSPIFIGLRKRVNELLLEWPDQPALKKILEILDRVESFQMKSPLMRFLTGVELLLGHAQEWETCAHSGVSIGMYLAEITDLVIGWRKLELQCWKNLLEITFQRETSETHKWWFYLYSVVMEVVESPAVYLKDSSQFLLNLHQFMETSPIGQFETRLRYLFNVHAHIVTLEQTGGRIPEFLHAYIWNTLSYYNQFQEAVRTRLTSLRNPIEQKMKDFVKISRWNDANYYALKASVLKSQKMLTKLVKDWKKALRIPVSTVFVADLNASEIKEKKSTMLRVPKQRLYVTPAILEEDWQLSPNLIRSLNVKRLKRVPKIYGKVQSIVSSVLKKDVIYYMEEIENLNQFSVEVIQTSHELQNIEMNDKKVGAERKKMLHNVHSRRRAGLADLFKHLQNINLSYRRGLVQMKGVQASQGNGKLHHDFCMEPMDIVAAWSHMPSNLSPGADKELMAAWNGCELYYQKCIARIAVMMKSFESPSKELGPAIVDRCKGFTADLMNVTSGQKQFIGNFTCLLWNLRLMSSNNFAEGQPLSYFQKFHQEAARVEYETKQLLLVVASLKGEKIEELKLRLNECLHQVIRKCKEVKALLGKYVTSVPIPHLSKKLMEGKKDSERCIVLFHEICHVLQSLESSSVLCNTFRKLKQGTVEFLTKIESEENEMEVIDGKSRKARLGRVVDQILQNMLLTFQKLEKMKSTESMEEISQILGQDFGSNLRKLSVIEIACFEIDKLVQGLLSLFRILRKENDPELSAIFQTLVPLFQQYSLLAQFYLTLFLQYHRATCKLLSIISSLFATLGSKGFCLPADYEQEAEAEGPEMDASGGMGLGEGETTPNAQDVSDRLESEDQLEDTLKEGETAAPADKDLDDDEKGVEMSEDFEGKQQDKEDRKEGGDDQEDDDEKGSDSEAEEDLDKEMGEVDDPENKLDEQMWGGSSDEEEDDAEEKEDSGKGAPQKSEPEIRAKDPTLEQESDSEEKDKPEDDKKKGKDFNEQDENEELNDDQVDPYHGQNQPEEEPEPFDLPDDLNLDDAEAKDKDEEGPEENPFDLDTKEKEDQVPEGPEEDQPEDIRDENQVSDDEDPEADKGVDVEKPTFEDDSKSAAPDDQDETMDENKDGKGEEEEPMEVDGEEPKPDEEDKENPVEGESEETKEKAEPSEETQGKSQDQTQVANEKAKPDPKSQPMDATEEENSSKKDETASGQAESQDGRGHEGQSVKNEQNQMSKQDQKDSEAKRKPGDTDENRALANESKETSINRLKTLDQPKESDNGVNPEEADNENAEANDAELYEHVRDGEKSDNVTIDNATKEQAEKQRGAEWEKSEETPKIEDAEEEELKMDTTEEVEEEKRDQSNETRVNDKTKRKGEVKLERDTDKSDEMEVDIEGEKTLTHGAARPATSTIETRLDLLEQWKADKAATLAAEARRDMVPYNEVHMTSAEESAALAQWHELDGKTLHLAQELCEQLRLVLEPTQAARLKGDYKTGKRLNMRKVIPYIASGFRKDKIWLRRTQPSKREYQILLALDDSASMSDNQSKQMAFSAVAVVARSLGLLEAGQLAVVGFGEEAELLHPFDEPFTDQSGAKLLNRFTFAQRSTRMAELLSFSTNLFADAKEKRPASSSLSPELAQLLLIVSDGRGVCHQGSDVVQKAVRRAREENVFIVFIIVDNPENKDSILDTRLALFGPNKTVEIAKYMDHFPFPFYLILRDLSTLPSVLSDALRQWFELVTSSER